MKLKLTHVILTIAAVLTLAVTPPLAFTQGDTKGKPTAKGQIQESGNQVGKAGTRLGHNVRRGRIVRGGKRFGQHIGYAGRHVGSGTKRAVKTVVKP